MECNKEEAVRAMDIAEKKMEKRDFVGARKAAVKAQQLHPDLLNISQMILVCDVHCAAQNKVYANESDWYSILQIEPTVDEAAIKKQFRKLALSLHPDKNKFAGASDAFKMIGEAQKVLLDREKRVLYDTKCKASGRYQASKWRMHQGSGQSNVRGHPWFQNKFMSNATSQSVNQQQQQQQQQSQFVKNRPTFWTICPFCSVKYQYYKDVLNKTLLCQSCKKSFTGYEMNPPGGTPAANSSQSTFPQQTGAVGKGTHTTVPQSTQSSSYKTAHQGNVDINMEMHPPGGTPATNSSQPTFPQQTGAVGKGTHTTVPQSTSESSSSKTAHHGSVDIKNLNRDSFPEKRFNKSNDLKRNSKKRNMSAESSESCNSESTTDSEEDIDIKEDGGNLIRQNYGYFNDLNLRRSTRSKQQVSYDENLSGDDEVNPSKRSKCSGSFHAGVEEVEGNCVKKAGLAADMVETEKEVKHEEISSSKEGLQNGEKKTEKAYDKRSEDDRSSDPQLYEYPDPDFSDFEKDRKQECFSAGQMWAVFDTLDAMPRFYALIRKVFSPGFRLRITWLEPDPDDEDKIKWVNEELPASCGKFRFGHSEISEDLGMFSHTIYWEKGSKRNTYKIYPKKGETWALFKGWDMNWHSDPQRKKEFDFEFVEVLSGYADNSGVRVAYLGKLKGFTSIFCRTVKDGLESFVIPAKDIYRFSHKVPSFQMSGKEGKNVPQGSFELDPASLPGHHDRFDIIENLNIDGGQMHFKGSSSGNYKANLEPKESFKEDASRKQFVELKVESKADAAVADMVGGEAMSNQNEATADNVELKAKSEWTSFLGQAEKEDFPSCNCNGSDNFAKEVEDSSTSASEAFGISKPEFHNFDSERSMEKFQVGQIWAVYSDEDALPKYYGRIQKIDSPPKFAVHLTWLGACSPSKDDVIGWIDKKMLICCGKFELSEEKPQMFTSTATFSHQLRVVSPVEKNIYAIFPEKGDIWAVYKSWNPRMTRSDLENCEYDIVEVLEKNELGITVLFLELVNGFKSIFKPQNGGQSTVQITWAELLRFSHQIPAFRLREEKDGSLRGFWELDPAALPT